MGRITVYHGGFCAVPTPEIRRGHFNKDFGDGFYCTVLKEQAERWAKRNDTPVISVYDVVIGEGMDVLDFPDMTNEWLDFIVSCRRGVPHAHDIVIGAMANDQIYNYVSDFVSGSITREQFWALMKFKYPTHQMAFCTERALQCLKFRREELVHA